MTFGEQYPLPDEYDWRYRRVLLMELTGWDFDTIDRLSYQDEQDIYVILSARNEWKKSQR